jgi:hypothetical protein
MDAVIRTVPSGIIFICSTDWVKRDKGTGVRNKA